MDVMALLVPLSYLYPVDEAVSCLGVVVGRVEESICDLWSREIRRYSLSVAGGSL